MNFKQLGSFLEHAREQHKKIFTTCSFNTHGLAMLHILARIDTELAVVSIDTGYHLPETLVFRE